jgi:hypothetical protein
MRTTLDIADDVLQAAKELGRQQKKTTGQVLSELARQALTQPSAGHGSNQEAHAPDEFMGFRPFPSRGTLVTNELVNRLREEDVY